MKTQYLLFIVFSAFWHAFFNFQMRKFSGERLFLIGISFVSAIAVSLIMIVSGTYKNIPWAAVPYVCSAAVFYAFYQILSARAYEEGEISKCYPLTVLSPVFIPFWAALFLSEEISVISAAGIAITISGAVMVKMNSFSFGEFGKMFRFAAEYRAARFALAASFVYSFGAVLDKSKIAEFELPAYLTILLFTMSVTMVIYFIIFEKQPMLSYFRKNAKPVIIVGITLLCSFYFFRIALQHVPVSLAVPVRLISIVFAILLGVFFLKEKPGATNLTGSLIIVAGIIIINLGI